MDITEYKKTVFATTDRVQIILMLYEGALKHLYLAREKMGNGDILSKGPHLGKATSIVAELSNALDMQKGGEIAEKLRTLYDFILQRLLIANLNNDITAIEDVVKVIEVIKDGWKEMMTRLKQPTEIAG